MTDRPLLEAAGITKRYRHHDALHAVDLIAHPGRVHGLLGPNGAGKTTLLRVLLGLVRRDAGSIRLLGCDLESTGRPLPEGVAGLVETSSFYPYLSGRQNLAVLSRLDGQRAATSRVRIEMALDQVGLSAHANARVGWLFGGHAPASRSCRDAHSRAAARVSR